VSTKLPLTPTPDRPFPNTYWVLPGRLLAGEYPGGGNAAEAQSRLASLHSAGIDSFIDLTEEGELPPYQYLLPEAHSYVRSGIVDASIPYNVSQVQGVLAIIQDGLGRDRRLYVHCRAGIGRTGLVIGCFLAEAEANGKKALKILNRLWQQSERSLQWPKIPQTAEQADYIKRWPTLNSRFRVK
jgi:hypothetical protein